MNDATRRALYFIAAIGLAFVLVRGVISLPAFGHYQGPYGLILNQIAVPQRHVTNIVASVNFDYRGVDTIGEEFILFASVAGVLLLLRAEKDEIERETPEALEAAQSGELAATSFAINAACQALMAPLLLFGVYVVSHGQLTPGGGFQGGAILASAFLMLFLAGEYRALQSLVPHGLGSAAEAVGAGGFVVIGVIGLLAGVGFLQNVVPLGPVGAIYSSGTIPLINLSVGLEVGAGFLLILLVFLRQTLLLRAQGQAQQRQQQGQGNGQDQPQGQLQGGA